MSNDANLSVAEFLGDHLSIKMFLVPRLASVAIGDGASHPLSGFYTSLAAAQADYPIATSLTNELAWCVIQTAVNYAGGHGSYLEIPYGTYLHDQTLTVGSIRIFGQTGQNVVKYTGSGTAWAISNAGFTIDGVIVRSSKGAYNSISNPTGAQFGFDLNTCSEYFVRNCFFGGAPSLGFGQAIRCIQSGIGTFRDNTISFCNDGINLEFGAYVNSHIVIDSNQFFAMARSGVTLTDCLQVYIRHNYFEAVQNGVLVDNSITDRQVNGVNIVTSCGSVFIEDNTFLETDETHYNGMLAFNMIGGSTTNLLSVYNLNITRNTVNIGSPPSSYAFNLVQASSPFAALTFKIRGNAVYGCATAAVHTDSANIHVTLEDNQAFTSGFDATSAVKPIIDGPGSQLGYAYDPVTKFLEVTAQSIDLTGSGEHDIILRDTSAPTDQQIVRWRKFSSNSFLEGINTAFNVIARGFFGMFGSTGNVFVGDPGDTGGGSHIPIDDATNKVQIQGPAKCYGQFIVGANLKIGTTQTFANEAAAVTGGLITGDVYKDSGGGLHIKL